MEHIDIENKLYQILDGKYYLNHEGQEYISVPNTVEEKHRAAIIYRQTLDDVKYDSLLSWSDAIVLSAKLGIWTSENDKSLKSLEDMLENFKLEIYHNHFNPTRVNELRKKIRQLEMGIIKSNNNKYTLYGNTKEYHADDVKRDFLVGMSLRDINNQRIMNYQDFWSSDHTIINIFKSHIDTYFVDPKTIRSISRKEPWRSMWISQKGEALGTNSVEWTDQQKLLVSFSRMYDNVYESMECPPDEIIKDDDMLDGWFIQQSRERQNKLKEKSTDSKFGNFKEKDGQELFIMAGSKNDIGQIYNMNDGVGKSIVHSREQVLKGSGKEFKHQDLPDVQRDLRMQANREWAEKMRR